MLPPALLHVLALWPVVSLGLTLPVQPRVRPRAGGAPSMGPSRARGPAGLGLRLRQQFYELAAPLDRGDFRWEFLVPPAWRQNKTLTTTDKFVVCSTFIGTSFTIQSLCDPGASVGVHLSYIAQFFSYAMADPIGFRLLAVLTSLLEIAGDLLETKGVGALVSGFEAKEWWAVDAEDAFPVLYNQLFIIINAYYILRWLLDWEPFVAAISWEPAAEQLYLSAFEPLGLGRSQFARLLRSVDFATAPLGGEGTTLCVQGEPLDSLFVPLNGTVEVRVAGRVATTLPAYQLVGEASLLENLQSDGSAHPPARATVVAAPGAAWARWSQTELYRLASEEDAELSTALQLMIARTLSAKLLSARLDARLAPAPAAAPTEVVCTEVDCVADGEGEAATEAWAAGGAAAEARALAARGEQQAQAIERLQGSLAAAKRQVSDQTALLFALAPLAGLAAAFEVRLLVQQLLP